MRKKYMVQTSSHCVNLSDFRSLYFEVSRVKQTIYWKHSILIPPLTMTDSIVIIQYVLNQCEKCQDGAILINKRFTSLYSLQYHEQTSSGPIDSHVISDILSRMMVI